MSCLRGVRRQLTIFFCIVRWQGNCGCLFLLCLGLSWVVPGRAIDLFCCWKGAFGRFKSFTTWCASPLCIMCALQRERNSSSFERVESSVLKLKLLVLSSLLDWMTSIGSSPKCSYWQIYWRFVLQIVIFLKESEHTSYEFELFPYYTQWPYL